MNTINRILGGDPFDERDKVAELLAKLNSPNIDGDYFDNWEEEPHVIETPEELEQVVANLGFDSIRDYFGIDALPTDSYPLWWFVFQRDTLNDNQVQEIEGFVMSNPLVVSRLTYPDGTRREPHLHKNADDFLAYVEANNG
jgi:hypothetical protein